MLNSFFEWLEDFFLDLIEFICALGVIALITLPIALMFIVEVLGG